MQPEGLCSACCKTAPPMSIFYAFDVLVLSGRDVMSEPLVKRRDLLENHVLPKLPEPIRCSPVLEASLLDLIQSIRAQGLEGLVAKRANSRYESGQRSGAWMKMRLNRSQEFIIGGYSVGGSTFDAVIVGHVVAGKLGYRRCATTSLCTVRRVPERARQSQILSPTHSPGTRRCSS
jgi:ATP-dependent DNA ligase